MYTRVSAIVAVVVLVGVLAWKAQPEPKSQGFTGTTAQSDAGPLDKTRPSEASAPAGSAAGAEGASISPASPRAKRVAYLDSADAAALGLTNPERIAVANLCAEHGTLVLGAIVRYGRFAPSTASKVLVSVTLPAEVASQLEKDFATQLAALLGPDIARRLAANPDIYQRISTALLDFGHAPLVLEFKGNGEALATSDTIEWTHVFRQSVDEQQATFVSGNLSLNGFRDVYGPLADKLLSSRSAASIN